MKCQVFAGVRLKGLLEVTSLLAGLVIVLFTNTPAWAQQEEQLWTSGQLTKVIPDSPWRIGVEGIYRYSNTRNLTTNQSFRTSIGYRLRSQTVLTLIHENTQAVSDRDQEMRLIAQGTHRFSFEHLDLGIRVRHEHRLFQDSKVWLHRSRALFRPNFRALQFLNVTPFVSQEVMYIWNTVQARSAGSTELRFAFGGSILVAEGLTFDLAYQDRQTYSDVIDTRTSILLLTAAYVF